MRGVTSPYPTTSHASGPTCASADKRTAASIRCSAHELRLAPAARKEGEQGRQEPLGHQALTSQADRAAGRCKAPAGCP